MSSNGSDQPWGPVGSVGLRADATTATAAGRPYRRAPGEPPAGDPWGGATPIAASDQTAEQAAGKPVMLLVGIVIALIGISGLVLGGVWWCRRRRPRRQRRRPWHRRRRPGRLHPGRRGGSRCTCARRRTTPTVVAGRSPTRRARSSTGGGTSRVDGAVQSTRVTLGSTATIGSVDVHAGPVAVVRRPRQRADDHRRPRRPAERGPAFVLLFVGLRRILAGLVLIIVGAVLRTRRRRPPPPLRPAYG